MYTPTLYTAVIVIIASFSLTLALFLTPIAATHSQTLPFSPTNDPLVIRTVNGLVRGETAPNGARRFLGLPFATPPLGQLRFRPPIAYTQNWTTTRDATIEPATCVQNGASARALYGKQSEDCLYLNVFVPSNGGNLTDLPVMLWFYGGSFVHGGIALSLYDGSTIAESQNVIVVTANYRLGIMGQIAADVLAKENPSWPTSGNQGLLDQQLAMMWVQDNAAAFGGDPSNVAIWGESAGAFSVCFHLVSPYAHGLFHKAILESGSCLQGTRGPTVLGIYNYTASTTITWPLMVERAGCTNNDSTIELTCMRKMNATKLVSLQENLPQDRDARFLPVVDGMVIPDDPITLVKQGKTAQVDLLLGTNLNEGTLFTPVKNYTTAEYHAIADRAFGALGEKVLAQYPLDLFPQPQTGWSLAQITGDYEFVCAATRLLRMYKTANKKYQYVWKHIPSFVKCPGFFCHYVGMGVYHSSELFFVFNYEPFGNKFTPQEQLLSDTMVQYWTSFARDSTPVATTSIAKEWPQYAYNAGSPDLGQSFMSLNLTLDVETRFQQNWCDFWDSVTEA
jgi:para-nitrobenzyl esterase